MITAVEAEALALERGGRRLFEGLSFHLHAGEALALTGPNGAGKTSLLRALAGLLRPAAGKVRFSGADGPLDPADARAAGLHWLGAQDGLKAARTAEAELQFWSRWSSPSPSHAPSPLPGSGEEGARRRSRWEGEGLHRQGSERLTRALTALGLADQAETEVRRLSTGQRRRLALARLLASPRPLWLLDEPLAPLDAAWRARAGELMTDHLASGGLLVAAVHDRLPVPARELRLEAA